MATDIVIDTCILVQANNPRDRYFEASVDLLESVVGQESLLLCMDPGYSMEARNKSHIFQEYRENLSPVVWTTALFAALFSSRRVKDVPRKVPNDVRLKVNKLIKKEKPRDRTFLKVAYNSTDRILVTHDGEDFPDSKRPKIKSQLAVDVLDAAEVALLS